MNATDKLMAWAQIWLSAMFLFFTFLVIVLYELGFTHFSADQEKSFSGNMNWLTGACLIIVYFWFQRSRMGGIPDSSQMVTQLHTAPDGTTTKITSPVNAPAAAVPTITPATPGDANATIKPSTSAAISPIGSDSRV